MNEIVHPLAEAYASLMSSPENDLLKQVETETRLNHPHAHMLSGHVQGRLLALLSKMIQPERILEIGTFTGYSALCLCEGLKPGGELHTIESRAEDAATARAYFDQSEYTDQIRLHIADAHQVIPQLDLEWDIVFIDADKTSYIDYYQLCLPRLNKNGIIIADNVLFHGQVLEETVSGKNAKAIQAFNEHVKNDPQVEPVLLTVRDGLLIIRKR